VNAHLPETHIVTAFFCQVNSIQFAHLYLQHEQSFLLAIESSCDETAAAVCKDGKILSNIIATQAVHEKYGGVVPELASRAHLQNIVPVVDEALKTADCDLSQLDAIAFTQAPGLIGSLLVGAQFAKSLSLALDKPLIAVHHMQAHVLANLDC
jgi:N6-L-threonylcarbamoyladenine synthase